MWFFTYAVYSTYILTRLEFPFFCIESYHREYIQLVELVITKSIYHSSYAGILYMCVCHDNTLSGVSMSQRAVERYYLLIGSSNE